MEEACLRVVIEIVILRSVVFIELLAVVPRGDDFVVIELEEAVEYAAVVFVLNVVAALLVEQLLALDGEVGTRLEGNELEDVDVDGEEPFEDEI